MAEGIQAPNTSYFPRIRRGTCKNWLLRKGTAWMLLLVLALSPRVASRRRWFQTTHSNISGPKEHSARAHLDSYHTVSDVGIFCICVLQDVFFPFVVVVMKITRKWKTR